MEEESDQECDCGCGGRDQVTILAENAALEVLKIPLTTDPTLTMVHCPIIMSNNQIAYFIFVKMQKKTFISSRLRQKRRRQSSAQTRRRWRCCCELLNVLQILYSCFCHCLSSLNCMKIYISKHIKLTIKMFICCSTNVCLQHL